MQCTYRTYIHSLREYDDGLECGKKKSRYIVNCSGTYRICCDPLRQIPNTQLLQRNYKSSVDLKQRKTIILMMNVF
jgi:hypothetical protein